MCGVPLKCKEAQTGAVNANKHCKVPEVLMKCNYTYSTRPKAAMKCKQTQSVVPDVAVKCQKTRRTMCYVPVKCTQPHFNVP